MGARSIQGAEQGIDVLGNVVVLGSMPKALRTRFIVFECGAGDVFQGRFVGIRHGGSIPEVLILSII